MASRRLSPGNLDGLALAFGNSLRELKQGPYGDPCARDEAEFLLTPAVGSVPAVERPGGSMTSVEGSWSNGLRLGSAEAQARPPIGDLPSLAGPFVPGELQRSPRS